MPATPSRVAIAPLGARLARAGVTPDAITVVGTVGAVASAVVFFPRGWLFAGTLLIWAFVMLDIVDGAVARAGGAALAVRRRARLVLRPDRRRRGVRLHRRGTTRCTGSAGCCSPRCCAWCSARSRPTSARAPRPPGCTATVGIAERAERLIIVLVGTGLTGVPLPRAVRAGDRAVAAGRRLDDHRRPAASRPCTQQSKALAASGRLMFDARARARRRPRLRRRLVAGQGDAAPDVRARASARRPTRPRCATAPARGSCARTCAASSARSCPSCGWTRSSATRCARTRATGSRRSGCEAWTTPQSRPDVEAELTGSEHLDAALGRGNGVDPRAAALGQLGRRRDLAGRTTAVRSPPSPSGSSPSRCSTASSPTARASAWRSSR